MMDFDTGRFGVCGRPSHKAPYSIARGNELACELSAEKSGGSGEENSVGPHLYLIPKGEFPGGDSISPHEPQELDAADPAGPEHLPPFTQYASDAGESQRVGTQGCLQQTPCTVMS